MSLILDIPLFFLGLFLGIWYFSVAVLPLFYGCPKALRGFFKGELRLKAAVMYLFIFLMWQAFFFLAALFLVFVLPGVAAFIQESGAFGWGSIIGFWGVGLLRTLFSESPRAAMAADFENFVARYRTPDDG